MSNLAGLRVDERLIHGQVATAWTNKVGAQRIMVIDDQAVKSDIDKMALKMACPANCKLSVLSTEKAILNLSSDKYGDERIFIVCKHPNYFLNLLTNGINFDYLVLGNMSSKEGSKMLRKSVYVNENDIEIIKQITNKGVQVVLQMTPSDTKEDFLELIKE